MQPFTFFISYRRQDTAPIALLLKSEIERRIRFARVAVDVEEMLPGVSFPDRIKKLIDEAHVTIALIGRTWMPRRGGGQSPRGGDDWVLRELEYSETAPLAHAEADRFGLTKRAVVPLFSDCERSFEQFELPESISYLTSLQAEQIDYASWPSDIGPLLDRCAVRFALGKRSSKDEYPRPYLAKARTRSVADAELTSILGYDDYEGWYVDNFGDVDARYIAKTFEFRGFSQAADFMAMVSNHCRVLNHHPEWRNVFNYVQVALTTWAAGRKVTIYDLNLALYMNMAAKAVAKGVKPQPG